MGMDLLSKRTRKFVQKRQERRSQDEAIASSLATNAEDELPEQIDRCNKEQHRLFIVIGHNPDTHGNFETLEEFNAAVDKISSIAPLNFSEHMYVSETRRRLSPVEKTGQEFDDLELISA